MGQKSGLWGGILRVVLPYVALGAAWILFSDKILLSFVHTPETLIAISTAKGWLYVLVTGCLLSLLLYGELRRRLVLEERLRDGLKEKALLLQELDHRVKNNLQLMASLLGLEDLSLIEESPKMLNARMLCRVRAMSLVYDSSKKPGAMAQIDLASYIQDLWMAVLESYGLDQPEITFSLQTATVSPDQATNFGLFAAELLSLLMAPIKHRAGSFPEGFEIRLVQEKERALFSICLSAAEDPLENNPGFLELVQLLAVQLKGDFSRNLDPVLKQYSLGLIFPLN